jgi:hypothetical protein
MKGRRVEKMDGKKWIGRRYCRIIPLSKKKLQLRGRLHLDGAGCQDSFY